MCNDNDMLCDLLVWIKNMACALLYTESTMRSWTCENKQPWMILKAPPQPGLAGNGLKKNGQSVSGTSEMIRKKRWRGYTPLLRGESIERFFISSPFFSNGHCKPGILCA
jgi:hypothetical protein